MRIRYLKNTDEILGNSSVVVHDAETLKGQWKEYFRGDRTPDYPKALYLEFGCGKGKFLRQMAQRYPENAYIGLEKISTILARAAMEADVEDYPNLRLMRADVLALDHVFAPGEADGIFLNFSDPWPKERHSKRRLTSSRFLALYERLLKPEGELEFKTDNDALFEFSIESLRQNGWEILYAVEDLHSTPLGQDNSMTEYEEAFAAAGKAIHKLCARKKPTSIL